MDWGVFGGIVGVIGVFVAVVAWRWPKSPHGEPIGQVKVEVAYVMPVFDMPDGSQDFGEDLVSVSVKNGTPAAVKATSWGIALPNGNIFVTHPTASWEPRLPHWIKPGDDASWHIKVDELRRIAAERQIRFDDMIAFVSFANGEAIRAEKGVPLA